MLLTPFHSNHRSPQSMGTTPNTGGNGGSDIAT